jgi:L-lactate dehydrogenase complex protein LldG
MNLQDKTSRELVLKNIRNAILTKTEMSSPDVDLEKDIYSAADEDLEILFVQQLIKAGGKFNYCATTEELLETFRLLQKENKFEYFFAKSKKIAELLENNSIPVRTDEQSFLTAKVGITGCEALVARLGSVMISSRQMSGRRLNFLPDTHIVIANANQIVYNIKGGFKKINEKYKAKLPSMITTITGPSRTADIEKTLVMGAHGPKELIVIIIEQSF